MSIKFLYNGIKCLENGNVLEKCFYEFDQEDGAIVVIRKEKGMFCSEIQNTFEPHELPEDDEEFAGHDCFVVETKEKHWKEMAEAAIKLFSKQAKKLEKKFDHSDKIIAEKAKSDNAELISDIEKINSLLSNLAELSKKNANNNNKKTVESEAKPSQTKEKAAPVDDFIGDGIALPPFPDEDECVETDDNTSTADENEDCDNSSIDSKEEKNEDKTQEKPPKKAKKKSKKKNGELHFINYKLGLSATIYEKEKTVTYFSKKQSPLQQSIPFGHDSLFSTIESILKQGYEVCSISAKEAIERSQFISTDEDTNDFLAAYSGKLFPALLKEISHNIKEAGMHIDSNSYHANLTLLTTLFER